MQDPGSWTASAVLEWDYPVSRDWLVLRDLRDWYEAVHASEGEAQQWPAPWDSTTVRLDFDDWASMPPDPEIEAQAESIRLTFEQHYKQSEE